MKRLVTSWEQLLENINKNIDYWAWYISKKSTFLKEDAKQELYIKVWQQYNKFIQANKKSSIYYFQKSLFHFSTRMILNDIRKNHFKFKGEFVKINICDIDDKISYNLLIGNNGEGELNNRKKALNITLKDLRKKLKDEDNEILNMIMKGSEYRQIAKKLGMKETALANRMKRNIRNPLKEMLLENYEEYFA